MSYQFYSCNHPLYSTSKTGPKPGQEFAKKVCMDSDAPSVDFMGKENGTTQSGDRNQKGMNMIKHIMSCMEMYTLNFIIALGI